jgi:cell division protein FtsW
MYTVVSGKEVNEASRWVNVFGQSFQPSDLAKIALIMYLAKLLTLRQTVIKDFTEGFLPAIFWVSIICGLVAPTNLSTAIVMFAASLMVMFIAGVELKYMSMLVAVGLVGLLLLFATAKRASTWKSRLNAYYEQLSTQEDGKYEGSYQALQSNIAIATGGVFGRGAGKSMQRNYLPLAFSDFVFAIIIEEYGLLGGIFVLGLYLILLFRTIMIVTVSRTYGALMAAGLAFMIVLQAIINMGVTVGVLPVTGLTLPMISMGGTSILFTCFSLGVILSVSRDAMEKKLDNNLNPKKVIHA